MQTVAAGSRATFRVTVSGSGPFTYQWQRNRVNLKGATQAALSFTATIADHNAAFRCAVKNSAGSAVSSEARLKVTASTSNMLYYAFEGNAADLSGHGLSGDVIGAGYTPAGKFGQGLKLNGEAYVSGAVADALRVGDAFTPGDVDQYLG